MSLKRSWVASANSNSTPFPLNNLPYGVFSVAEEPPRCGVAIGDQVLDVTAIENAGLIGSRTAPLCQDASWNPLMALPATQWSEFRESLTTLLAEGGEHQAQLEAHLYPLHSVQMYMPFTVSEFTDFYAGRNHATNVGTMFRGADNALPPNWLHIPIGYNGRASSVVVSGTGVRRPWGQLKSPDQDLPALMPSRRFDMELEMGAIVGNPSNGPVSVDQADAMIFGYVLLNDWSARDIQAWEYQPLGPFQAKATATSISPWIVSKAALEAFRVATPERDFKLLPHLQDTTPMLYDIELSATLAPQDKAATTITQTNYREMYFSAAQQLAHHASSGCPMRCGDLLGSGTISGAEKHQRGSLLELSWGGKEPMTLDTGDERTFLQDGDTITLTGHAKGDGFIIGFGDCGGTLLAALDSPYSQEGQSS